MDWLKEKIEWVKNSRMKGLSDKSIGYKREEYLYWQGYLDALSEVSNREGVKKNDCQD